MKKVVELFDFRRSIKAKQLVFFTILVIGLTTALGLIYLISSRVILEREEERVKTYVNALSNTLDSRLTEILNSMDYVSDQIELRTVGNPRFKMDMMFIFNETVHRDSFVSQMAIVDNGEKLIVSYPLIKKKKWRKGGKFPPKYYTDSPEFKLVDYQINRQSDFTSIFFFISKQIRSESGKRNLIVKLDFSGFVKTNTRLVNNKHSYFYIASNDKLHRGLVIEHENPEQILKFDLTDDTTKNFGPTILNSKTGSITYIWQNEKKLAYFNQLKNGVFPWIVVYTVHSSVLLHPVFQVMLPISLVMGILLFVLGIFSIFIGAAVVFPIAKMERVINDLAEGKIVERFEVKTRDEIGRIANSLNTFSAINNQRIILSQQVEERTEAIKELLDSTGQGFLSFGADCRIQSEYSLACSIFFGENIASRNVLDLLFADNRERNREIIDFFFAKKADPYVLMELLPAEISAGERILTTEYRWVPAKSDSDNDKLMVVLTDVTHERELEDMLAADDQFHNLIIKVAMGREEFIQMVRDMKGFIQKIENLLQKEPHDMDTNELFRCFHTIKGIAASCSMNEIVEKVHAIENEVDKVRSGELKISKNTTSQISQNNAELSDLLELIINKISGFISKEELEESSRILQVKEDSLKNLELLLKNEEVAEAFELFNEASRKIVEDLQGSQISSRASEINELGQKINRLSTELRHTLLMHLADLQKQPIGSIFNKYANSATQLANKLGKEIEIEIKGAGIRVNYNELNDIFNALEHLIRNSVDHGIESSDLRLLIGKIAKGKITMEAEKQNGDLILTFSDDGAGIDIEQIKAIALSRNLIDKNEFDHLTEKETLDLIFSPGFSTAETVTDVSGRGVGMDAVKTLLDQLGGEIRIQTEIDKGSQFNIRIPNLR